MIGIPRQLESEFEGGLRKKAIPNGTHWGYKKWLRYYLDFCHKYGFPHAQRESPKNLVLLRGKGGYEKLDRYKQAVLGINHVLETQAFPSGVRLASGKRSRGPLEAMLRERRS
jgi:hypothetical protein